jgi:hypothetical protein
LQWGHWRGKGKKEDRLVYTMDLSVTCSLFSFSHLLLMVNASVNFLIYCSLSTGFKMVIRSIIIKIQVGATSFFLELKFFVMYFTMSCFSCGES